MKCGLLGERLGHSLSPQIHRLLGDYSYELAEVSPCALPSFLETTACDGLNVTIPYKKTVLPFCQSLSDEARAVGAVNTMVRNSDGWHGYNTDVAGFACLLSQSGFSVEGKRCLVLGSGGASAAVCYALEKAGGNPVVVSRTGEVNYENVERYVDAPLLVNATPVGMYPDLDSSPLDLRRLPGLRCLIDLIYNPSPTALLRQAASLGIPSFGGLLMLVAQAKYAAELFTGREIADGRIEEILPQIEKLL